MSDLKAKVYAESEVKWAEFIPVLFGRYSVCMTEDDDQNTIPCLSDTKEEVEKDIQEEVDRYNEEIADGERDEDDEYEGMCLPCVREGDELVILLEGTWEESERFNWKKGL